jgi:hypothetical protein
MIARGTKMAGQPRQVDLGTGKAGGAPVAPDTAGRAATVKAAAREASRPSRDQETEERLRRQRMRSIAIALALGGLVVLFYLATIVRLGGNVINRPL